MARPTYRRCQTCGVSYLKDSGHDCPVVAANNKRRAREQLLRWIRK